MLYFLPRHLELVALGEIPAWSESDYCLARLSEVDWRGTWPAGRWKALNDFFWAYLSTALADAHLISLSTEAKTSGYYDYTHLRSAITLVANAGADLSVLGRILEGADGSRPALATAALIIESRRTLLSGAVDWSLISKSHAQQLALWLTGIETLSELTDTQAGLTERVQTETLFLGVSILTSARPARVRAKRLMHKHQSARSSSKGRGL